MATTSIWRVKGWLGKVVIYVENPDKTVNPAFYKNEVQSGVLSDVINYAVDQKKTSEVVDENIGVIQQFVSGVNCYPKTVREEMLAVKKRFDKEGGTVAYHGYQSFAKDEVTPEIAHEIGVKLATQLWGEKYQVLVATHLDKENHLHNHFVLNTVSFVDGIKYHRTAKDYREMQITSDNLCKEYQLSVIINAQKGKSKHYAEWEAEKENKPTWRSTVRDDLDEAIKASMTVSQVFKYLSAKGYEIKQGKDISVRPPGKERFFRLERNLGEEYSYNGIAARLLEQSKTTKPLPEPERKIRRYQCHGNLKIAKKVTGFRALYFHYCYLLGIFPKNNPRQNSKRLHFLLREDLIKLDAVTAEVKLLCNYHIDTAEQLSLYKQGCEDKINDVSLSRKALYKKMRTKAVSVSIEKVTEVKTEIGAFTKQLSELRKEVKLCDDIFFRSGIIKEKINIVRGDETGKNLPERKEPENEQLRRRSRTNR